MIYLDSFKFTSFNDDLDFRPSEVGIGWYETKYPFGILSYHQIERIDFDTITIFYGGNGCGKTTALNIIAEKLKLKRDYITKVVFLILICCIVHQKANLFLRKAV